MCVWRPDDVDEQIEFRAYSLVGKMKQVDAASAYSLSNPVT